nr:hypothetical protein BN993_03171 [Virgibacillus halodenitrificans]
MKAPNVASCLTRFGLKLGWEAGLKVFDGMMTAVN